MVTRPSLCSPSNLYIISVSSKNPCGGLLEGTIVLNMSSITNARATIAGTETNTIFLSKLTITTFSYQTRFHIGIFKLYASQCQPFSLVARIRSESRMCGN
jgi:hypothetical protein